MKFSTVNPANGKVIQEYTEFSDPQIEKVLQDSQSAFKQWSKLSFAERARHMQVMADYLLREKNELAKIITLEMGKPLSAAIAEIEKCALVCHHYAEKAEDYLMPRMIQTEMQKSYVTYKPLGPIFNIMPWNFPFWQVFRFAAPNLMAGNTAILRHAPITTGCGLLIEKSFEAAGFPKDVFRTVIVSNDQAATIIAHPVIAGVTLTGSERAGRIVGAEAAGALKKVVLELGGSDPYIILEDADLNLAAELCVKSRLSNSGQICIAAKRLIVVEKIYEAFKQKVLALVQQYRVGDPMDPNTQMGPMARDDLRDQLQEQIKKSVAQGAKILFGGEAISGDGYYFSPTVMESIPENSPAYCDELFGPVISLFKVKDESEAIRIANDTRFGLGAGVFTKDIARGEKIAQDKLNAGCCVVNTTVASDPRLPFGGSKGSGYGRELSAEGIKEFVNIKTVVVN